MLGLPKTRDLDRPVLIAIESAVPKDHFYQHLHRVLDLSFVRDLAVDRYASGGRPSIAPIVFFKLELMMFFEVHRHRAEPEAPTERGGVGTATLARRSGRFRQSEPANPPHADLRGDYPTLLRTIIGGFAMNPAG